MAERFALHCCPIAVHLLWLAVYLAVFAVTGPLGEANAAAMRADIFWQCSTQRVLRLLQGQQGSAFVHLVHPNRGRRNQLRIEADTPLRMSGGFDKMADDDSAFQDLHDLLEDVGDDGEPLPINTKERMNRQVCSSFT